MTEHQVEYLILGSGAAGFHAATAIRSRDKEGRLMMVTTDQVLPYKRPMLSKTPIRTLRDKGIGMHAAEWYQRNNIQLMTGCRVLSMDTKARRAVTEMGTISYAKCIYALGGENFIPPIPGRELPGVVSVRTLEDLRALKKYTMDAGQAVIIGGGVIGLEMAVELRRYGVEVTVLEAMARLMPRQLDEETSARLLDHLEDITIHTGVSIAQIEGEDRVGAVTLADGRRFPCGVVMISCGLKANIEVAQAAGIACNRAVVVNRRMETDTPHIWACGDCAEVEGINFALWSQAMAQGVVAGANAAGDDKIIGAYDRSLILNNERVSLFSLGDLGSNPEKRYESVVEEKRFDGFSINEKPVVAVEKRYYCDGKLTGGCILGNLSGMEQMKKDIEEAAAG